MRNSKAKELRKVAEAYTGGTALCYETKKHKPKLVQIGINADGTKKETLMTPITVYLGDCERRMYKHLKRTA